MPWAVWDNYDDGNLHVVPVTPDGEVAAPHILDKRCCCEPHLNQWNDEHILVHEQIQ